MSDARREARGERLDIEIDRAVREMLDVEPPAGLRGRVMERIDAASVASGVNRKIWWLVAPIAAAAVIVIALVLPRHGPIGPVAPGAQSVARVNPPAVAPVAAPPLLHGEPPPAQGLAVHAGTAPRERQAVAAAVAADEAPVPGFPQVPSLSISQLNVPEIRRVEAVSAPTDLGVEPIATPAPIDLEPLPLSPRERHDQE